MSIPVGLIFGVALLLSGCMQIHLQQETPTATEEENLGYFSGEEEFSFELTGLEYPINPSRDTFLRFDAKYIGQTNKTADSLHTYLDFEQVGTGARFTIKMKTRYASPITLNPDTVYQVVIQFLGFISHEYGLMITDNNDMVFLGISGGYSGGGKDPYNLSPIQITEIELLKNHFKPNPDDCVTRFTNTKIRFESDGATLKLHQGETGKLGKYEIDLLVAGDVEYPNPTPCYDIDYNPLSFLVYKYSK